MDTLDCTCIVDLGKLRDYAEDWEKLRQECGGSVFTSYYLSKAWLEAFKSAASPCIIVLEEAGEVVGIAPLITKRQAFASIPVRALSLIGDADQKLALDPLRLLVSPGRPDVMDRLIAAAGRQWWNLLNINYLQDCVETRQLIEQVKRTWDAAQPTAMSTITCRLPETGELIDHYGSHTRHKLGQCMRKAEREVDMVFREVSPDCAEEAVNTYVRQHLERWGAKGGSIFRDPENVTFLKNLMKEAMARGDGMAHELLMNGEVAAQEFSFRDGSLARGYRLGMNNAYAMYAPGLLISYMVMTKCRDLGFEAFYRGGGGENYKLRMGGEETSLIGVQAKRGAVSWLSHMANSSPMQRVSSMIDLRGRAAGGGTDGLAGQAKTRADPLGPSWKHLPGRQERT